MKPLTALIILASFMNYTPAFAAIGCKPGMGNCPKEGREEGRPNPRTSPPEIVKTLGYAEVVSQDCLAADLEAAKAEAASRAQTEAEFELQSETVRLAAPIRFVGVRCGQSIYDRATDHAKWIVTASGTFAR